MKKIKTFEDACKALKLDPATTVPQGLAKDVVAYIKLTIIAKALNGKWIPNWDDHSEWKYYPWFRMSSTGFSSYGYYYWYSHSDAGSRLCFKTSSLAEYAGKQFTDIYKDFLTLQ